MRLVAVADIFGKTKYLRELLNQLSSKYETIKIIDPYDHPEIDFKNEQEAYHHFQNKIGLSGYIDKLYHYLKSDPSSGQHLLGFSVGASAVWAVSEMFASGSMARGICFYSSQIRNYLNIRPDFEIDLYFPRQEPSFDVDTMIRLLTNKKNVNCFKTGYLHGFMNKKSIHYSEEGCSDYIERLKKPGSHLFKN